MRGAPHVEFSATMRKISSRNSLLMHFLPAQTRRRESHVQYSLNPARCRRTTDSGWTRINAGFHSGQSRRNHPEQLVGSSDQRSRTPLLQNDKLLAKSQVLKQQVAARVKDAVKEDRQRSQQLIP